MSSPDLKRLFDTVLSDPAVDGTDVEAAIVRGRRRRRGRQWAVAASASAVVLAVVTLLVVSVRAHPDQVVVGPSPSPTASQDLGAVVTRAEQIYGPWQLASLGGVTVGSQGKPVGIHFGTDPNTAHGQSWGADDGCNYHNGTFTLTAAGVFTAVPGMVTAVGCHPPFPGVPESIEKAHELRLRPASGSQPATLAMIGADGSTLATYTPYPWATNPSVLHESPTGRPPSVAYLASYASMLAFDAVARATADGWTTLVVAPDDVATRPSSTSRLTFITSARGIVVSATAS